MFVWGEAEHCDPQQPERGGANPLPDDYFLNLAIDYVVKMLYRVAIPLVRGVSGDDPAGGAGSGVDSGP